MFVEAEQGRRFAGSKVDTKKARGQWHWDERIKHAECPNEATSMAPIDDEDDDDYVDVVGQWSSELEEIFAERH